MDKKTLGLIESDIKNTKNLKELNETFDAITKIFESRKAYLNLLNEANELSNKNFGYIKDSFEALSPLLFESEDGRDIMKRYVAEIKSNNALKSLYSIYENIYHAPANIDATYLINETFSKTIDKAMLREGVEKLGRILAEAYILLNGHSDAHIEENKELNESIDYLATTTPSLNKIKELSVKRNIIGKYIADFSGKALRESAKPSSLDEYINGYNSKYSNLDEEEAQLLKKISSSTDKKALFEEYKQKCMEAIDETLKANQDNVNIERVSTIKEALLKKEYNENTLGTDIANFIELQETINA